DAFVQGGLGVVGQDGHRGLGQDRSDVHFQEGHVDGGARLGHTGGQGVVHGVPSREVREQRRMGVEDPTGEGVVDRLVEHGGEPGHHHDVDIGGHAGVGGGPGVPVPVEVGTDPPVVGPVHQDRGNGGIGGYVEGPARAVGGHQPDRQVAVQD